MATFAQQVFALRSFFGMPDQASTLPEAVMLMNEQMGLVSDGPTA